MSPDRSVTYVPGWTRRRSVPLLHGDSAGFRGLAADRDYDRLRPGAYGRWDGYVDLIKTREAWGQAAEGYGRGYSSDGDCGCLRGLS
jgi:hypothetical protein